MMWTGDSTSVKVSVRIRPFSERQRRQNSAEYCVESDAVSNKILIPCIQKQFQFDAVLSPDSDQEEVFTRCVESLVDSCFEGYNSTVMAYGQTGSGKTYTMGSAHFLPGDVGIIPRVIESLYQRVDSKKDDMDCEVFCSFVEIYNEEIHDLLDPDEASRIRDHRNPGKCIKVTEDPETKQIVVLGACSEPAMCADDLMTCLERGSLARRTGATLMNSMSSRSHAIFTIGLIQRGKEVSTNEEEKQDVTDYRISKFHFVDLAGSERAKRTQATGTRFREGVHINGGLLALGNVICALTQPRESDGSVSYHVPYRDSKLTRILQDSLGGNSKTLMIACVSGSQSDFAETYNTIKYACRARNIRNCPMVNRDPTAQLIASLRQQVHDLTKQLLMNKRVNMDDLGGEMDISELRGPSGFSIGQLEGQLDLTNRQLTNFRIERDEALSRAAASESKRVALIHHLEKKGVTIDDADPSFVEEVHKTEELVTHIQALDMQLATVQEQYLDSQVQKDSLLAQIEEKRKLLETKTADNEQLSSEKGQAVSLYRRIAHLFGRVLKRQEQKTEEETPKTESTDDDLVESVLCSEVVSNPGSDLDEGTDNEPLDIPGVGLIETDVIERLVDAEEDDREEVLALVKGCNELTAERQEVEARISELDADISHTKGILHTARQEASHFEEYRMSMQKKIEDMYTTLRVTEEERDNLNRQIDQAKATSGSNRKDLEAKHSNLLKKIDNQRQAITSLQKEKDTVNKERIQGLNQIRKLERDIIRCKEERAKAMRNMRLKDDKNRQTMSQKQQIIEQLRKKTHLQKVRFHKQSEKERQECHTLRKKLEEARSKVRWLTAMNDRRTSARNFKNSFARPVTAPPRTSQRSGENCCNASLHIRNRIRHVIDKVVEQQRHRVERDNMLNNCKELRQMYKEAIQSINRAEMELTDCVGFGEVSDKVREHLEFQIAAFKEEADTIDAQIRHSETKIRSQTYIYQYNL
eukprot:GHVL01031532.1.p1 GENE.GHVL01031532.1~~GHVL01031532.1.p1  ORF type:complete len:983 (+),score=191.95 GHVL01031532.1:70-3018(+)